MDRHHFNTIFEGLILSRLRYALPVRSVILSAELAGQINSFLKHAYKYGFSNKIQSVDEIAKETYEMLFFNMKCKQHCLNPTLPPLKPNTRGLRPRGHSYQLPECWLRLRNNSCVIRCLYRYVRYDDDDGAVHCCFSFSV